MCANNIVVASFVSDTAVELQTQEIPVEISVDDLVYEFGKLSGRGTGV